MRHLNTGRKLGRTAAHRKATMRALSIALIKNHRIVTTVAKAKELRRYFEPLVTKAKEDTTHRRRQLFAFLRDKEAVTLMFDEIAAVVGDRPGGYTRVIKIGARQGDGAEMAMIELVDFNDVKPESKSTKKRRTRRGSSRRKTTNTAKKTETSQKTEVESVEPSPEQPEATKAEEIKSTAEEVDSVEAVEEPKVDDKDQKDTSASDTKKEE